MALNYTAYGSLGGISKANRQRLSALLRGTTAPFGVTEAVTLLATRPRKTRRFLAYLAARGWLTRLRRGLYVAPPLDASTPSEWREDPWIVATTTFSPCYIGGWSACEHWSLTEQIFRDIVVITSKQVRTRHPMLQGTAFRIKVLPQEKLFGTVIVWRKRLRTQVSDPSRTLVDILDDPSLGGGMHHIAGIVAAYFSSKLRDEDLLLRYIGRFGNRTVYKRLGYLVESLQIDAPAVLEACRSKISSGMTVLDPTIQKRGHLLRRWNLWINTEIRRDEDLS